MSGFPTATAICRNGDPRNEPWQYNMLPRQPTGGSLSVPSLAERMRLMSTYEEFMVMLTIALLIVAILNLKNK